MVKITSLGSGYSIRSRGYPPLMNYFVGIIRAERGGWVWWGAKQHGTGSLVNR